MGKLKKKLAQHNKINTKTQIDSYPIFCFKYLVDNPKNDPKSKFGFYAEFIGRLKKLSNLGWNEINNSDRHGFGMEKIPIGQIKRKDLPSIITPEIKDLFAFRATGDNRPFLGIRNGNIFHIILIEENFGDVYNH